MGRKLNFYAGPSTLPAPVLEELAETVTEHHGNGISLIETSHRSPLYDQVHNEAITLVKELLSVPEDFYVLFLGGGATLQFAMLPMNLLPSGGSCDFTVSGHWAKKALDDAKKIGSVNVIYDGAQNGYSSLPNKLICNRDSAYVHLTSNETINGVQWPALPACGETTLAIDMSSDIMSRKFNFKNVGIVYAGAQKNLGPAGVTLIIARKDLVEKSTQSLPAYLSYKTHADKNSLYNTPPVFSIYALQLVLKRIKEMGGLSQIEKSNTDKASKVYNAIDLSEGFYVNDIDPQYRSKMNIVFNLPQNGMEQKFLTEAGERGMLGLKAIEAWADAGLPFTMLCRMNGQQN